MAKRKRARKITRKVNKRLAKDLLTDFEALMLKDSKKKRRGTRLVRSYVRKRKKPYSTKVAARARIKILTSPGDGKEFSIAKQEFLFIPRFKILNPRRDGDKIRNFIKTRLYPQALRFFKKYGPRSQHFYIVRVGATHSYNDSEYETGFSIPRFYATKEKFFRSRIERLANEIIGRYEVYLRSKSLEKITIHGFSIEVMI